MSQFKNIVRSPFFAATAGATALATVLLVPTFDGLRGVVNGQSPATAVPAPTATNALPPVDAAAPLSANPNPNPLGIGVGTPPTPPVAAPAPNVPGAVDPAQLEALRARAQQLQSELRRVPTTAEEQQAQQRVVSELVGLQTQIQQIEASAGQFAAYRRARDAQAQAQNAGASPFAAPTFAGGYDGISGGIAPNLGPAATPTPNPLGDRQAALAASGLNAVAPQAVALDPSEAAFLREQKETLTRQYRQLQQTQRALQPGDEALAAALKEEETALLAQLKDVETRLAAAPAAQTNGADPNAFAAGNLPGALNAVLPTPNQIPNADAGASVAAKMEKASQAAALLREVGLVGLANHVATEVPNLANPNFVETQLVPGAWSEGAGLAEDRANPFQQISAQDVEAIQTSIDDLKTRVDSLAETLANVETQLRLLTRQTVAEPVAPAVPDAEVNLSDAVPASDAVDESLSVDPADLQENPIGGEL